MQIPGKLTEADLSEVQARIDSKNLWMERLISASESVAATVGIWSAARVYLGRTPPVWADVTIAMVLSAIMLCGIYFRRRKRRQELILRNESQPELIGFTDQGIQYEWQRGPASLVQWITLQGWKEGRRVIVVKSSKGGRSLILPVASLSEIQRATVRQLLRANLRTLEDRSNSRLSSPDAATISKRKSRLLVLSKILLGMFGLSFFFAGALIHFLHPQTDRIRAEMEGQLTTVLFLVLHVTAIVVADRTGWGKFDPKGPKSLSDALRK